MIDFPKPALIGVVHLPPLPGSPLSKLGIDGIVEHALRDARTLHASGFDAVIVENFGDAPFVAENLPPACIAALAVVADRIRGAVDCALGINALRNDAQAAIGIAAVMGAAFVRVNVHVGVYATDQGMIEGQAAESLRYRRLLDSDVAILADVHVKHATPVSEPDLGEAARNVAYRGLADGLIVTGPRTGAAVDPNELDCVRAAVPDRRIFIGSGATAQTVKSLLERADGVIVGTALKRDGDISNPIDAELARDFVEAARSG